MTALYLERFMNYGLTPDELRSRQADHRHRADRQRPLAVQPHPSRTGEARARRHPRRRRHSDGIPGPSDLRELPPPDRGARPQPRLSRPGRDPARLSDRRGGADHRLRQDHAGADHGRVDRRHPGDRAVGRADARRLARGRAGRLRHRDLALAPQARRRRDRRGASSSQPRRRQRALGRAIATPWAPPRR